MISKEAKRLYDIEYRRKNYIKIQEKQKIKTRKNKETKKIYDNGYRKNNIEKLKAVGRKYYLLNRDIICEKSKKWIDNNKEKAKIRRKEYYRKNKEVIRLRQKIYAKKNKEHIKSYMSKYKKDRLKIDVHFKLTCYLRARVWNAIKRNTKSEKTMTLVGCDIKYLKKYLEDQFTEGMSWDNYGDWHMDHIKPCALFDLSKPEQQLKCFHYTNLQPLWSGDNLRKSDTYDGNV